MFDNPIPENIDKAIGNALQNLTDKPTSIIGTTLADIWFLVFGHIPQIAEKKRMKYAYDLKKFETELQNAIQAIPESNLIEPDIQTAAQALEASRFCISSDELRLMFVNLISGTVNKDIEPCVHPSFPMILKQMSRNDAIFLRQFKDDLSLKLPAVNLGIKSPDGENYRTIENKILSSYDSIPSDATTLSGSSLERLGIFDFDMANYLVRDDAYDFIKSLPVYETTESMGEIYLVKGICNLSPLGKNFVTVCV